MFSREVRRRAADSTSKLIHSSSTLRPRLLTISRPSLCIRSHSNMSDSQPKKYTFLLYAPDYTDSEALNRRLAVRPKHLENAKVMFNGGVSRIGGALVSPDSYDTPNRKMVGSMMVFEAENIEAVRKIVEQDVYYTGGVWDKERLVIIPWVSAHPLPTPPPTDEQKPKL
ncbi:hypothetical protein BDY19DRAFT_725267 [Irpex rosettiformis]|uniref:Uncharacterized protein n=1 Tax=Irpex rosettiformis TaxID=378272 RepID=A0ACB8U8I8_9APHY|nr:hypothetical protein BDY19DRAFT_725267 [Irpex rosettiformis]